MTSLANIRSQIERITVGLIEQSLCNYQNFPTLNKNGSLSEIAYSGVGSLSIALKDVSYQEIYDAYDQSGAYNFKMVDGALVQLLYRYEHATLKSHRLAFFPSPYLDQFQNDPEIYENDVLFSEVIDRSVVAFPMRFDFDSDDATHVDPDHPKCHFTLGEYANCRIPVAHPVTPYWFMDFVLRNFYNTAYKSCSAHLPKFADSFEMCITKLERGLMHLRVET